MLPLVLMTFANMYILQKPSKSLSHSTLKSLAIWAHIWMSLIILIMKKGNTTTLNRDFLHTIQTKADEYVIYADLCTLSQRELEKMAYFIQKNTS